ncbi:hypothetical protein AERO9AM_20742 [Aeromicrobium sp. 9AM]|nr:hypothetical protein AERO9AM_20742 [Aeromicrobium sp. 9AM]
MMSSTLVIPEPRNDGLNLPLAGGPGPTSYADRLAQAPVAQLAEADGLNPSQCGFDPHREHVERCRIVAAIAVFVRDLRSGSDPV